MTAEGAGGLKRRAVDTVLGHCMVRAMLAAGVTDPAKVSPWLAVKVTPKASRVASFIVFWARAMEAKGGPIGIEEYAQAGYSSRAKAYRDQAEFRELWPEFDTPEPIAQALLDAARSSGVSPSAKLRLALA